MLNRMLRPQLFHPAISPVGARHVVPASPLAFSVVAARFIVPSSLAVFPCSLALVSPFPS
jgi:hypothetical protein